MNVFLYIFDQHVGQMSCLDSNAHPILPRTVGICVSESQGSFFDLQNSQSKLAAPREKRRTSMDNDCEIRKWDARAVQMTGEVMCKSQDEVRIKT